MQKNIQTYISIKIWDIVRAKKLFRASQKEHSFIYYTCFHEVVFIVLAVF